MALTKHHFVRGLVIASHCDLCGEIPIAEVHQMGEVGELGNAAKSAVAPSVDIPRDSLEIADSTVVCLCGLPPCCARLEREVIEEAMGYVYGGTDDRLAAASLALFHHRQRVHPVNAHSTTQAGATASALAQNVLDHSPASLPESGESSTTHSIATVEALEGLFKLIEDGDLVRDISKDSDFVYFAHQGHRITNAIGAACKALALIADEPDQTNQGGEADQG